MLYYFQLPIFVNFGEKFVSAGNAPAYYYLPISKSVKDTFLIT